MEMPAIDAALWNAFVPYLAAVGAVIVVILVALIAIRARNRSRRRAVLSDRFAHEYERTLERAGSRRRAESDLSDRLEHRQMAAVRPLSDDERDFLCMRWEDVQATFVDAPAVAVRRAEDLVRDVMKSRGYRDVDDRALRVNDLSVDHPDAVESYRTAIELLDGSHPTTEDRREALLALRTVFDALIREVVPSDRLPAHH